MKNIIKAIGKKLGYELEVQFVREDFDILGYEVYLQNEFVCYDRYFTGKTNNGNKYPSDKNEFLIRIEESINQHLKKLNSL